MRYDHDPIYHNKLSEIVRIWANKADARDNGPEDYVAFADLIGFPNPEMKGLFIVDIRKSEVKALIDKLCGPHCATLLKVMEIQRGKG